ncbi:thiamine ABC transporter substrate-binding protein [Natronococcus occultus]|uniref:ABC-type thiamine transport system, periplasmic component n=1 Tax=Natronococcus occultus SP4 TaxID=694430 RepID=L0K6K1_9EURY|nr:extracellular solute-binding protein [Natronococcus occultus]AGB39758.1 ABC-type thiamine transport system, periplasmic component [Natronococcus occultus SP4]
MNRRAVVRAVGVGALTGAAGCFSREDDEDDADDATDRDDVEPDEPDLEGVLRVATTESMVVGERAVGDWLREAFEEEFPDAELQWTVPEAGLEHYRRRVEQDAEIDADVYLGLTPPDLADLDARLAPETPFRELNDERLPATDRFRDDLAFGDPWDRVVPTGVRYSCLWYDENDLEAANGPEESSDDADEDDLEVPDALEELPDGAYEDALVAPDPGRSDAGLAFLLWVIETVGEDEFIRYWGELDENGLELTDDWEGTVTAFADGHRPLAAGYTTDAAYAEREGWETDGWEVVFPDERGYETPIGAAVFEDAVEVDLAYDFLNFLLSADIQAELAVRHSQIPALSRAFLDLDESFEDAIAVPSEPVSIGYDRLREELTGWRDAWANAFPVR